jgi:hypothetical protein
MNRGKEENKLSSGNFKKKHNEENGCRVELEYLGFCLGLDKNGKRAKLPVVRLKCFVHDITSKKYLGEVVKVRGEEVEGSLVKKLEQVVVNPRLGVM